MAATFSAPKAAAAKLDYVLDWSAWLGADTIASADWTVTGATEVSEDTGATTSAVRVSGGTAGTTATAQCAITTAAGLVGVRSIELTIVASIPATTIVKAPGEVLAVPAPSWSDLGSDTIATYTWTAVSGLTIDSGSSTATVVISGGTLGADYTLTCHVTMASGQEDERVITVQVRER